MKNNKLFSLFILLWMASMLHAQIDTDRPDHTESPFAVAKGAFQIETGIQIGVEEEDHLSTRHMLLPTTLLRYGIAQGIELRLEHNFESIKTGDQKREGFSDLEIGTKINLLTTEKTGIAFLTSVIIPTGSVDFSNDKWGTSNIFAFSHELSNNLELAIMLDMII